MNNIVELSPGYIEANIERAQAREWSEILPHDDDEDDPLSAARGVIVGFVLVSVLACLAGLAILAARLF